MSTFYHFQSQYINFALSAVYHLLFHSIYYEYITIISTNQQYHIKYTIHQNLRGNPNGRKPQNVFLYVSRIHS
jgi:hypothetical protein